MDNKAQVDVTQLLKQFSDGRVEAKDEILLLFYDELRGMASGKMRRENAGHTLQPTALVHELWSKFESSEQRPEWPSRGHFFKWASKAMGNYLRDYARHKNSQKAGGDHVRISLEGHELLSETDSQDGVLDVLEAMEELAAIDSQLSEIVELRAFGGLNYQEIAEVLGLTDSKVDHSLQSARSWLAHRLRHSRQQADETAP